MRESDGRGRKWRSRQEAAALVRECEASGVSQREFCAERGVALSTLTLYRRRIRAGATPKLLPVNVLAAVPVVVAHPNGLRIELGRDFDADTLRRLLETLEA